MRPGGGHRPRRRSGTIAGDQLGSSDDGDHGVAAHHRGPGVCLDPAAEDYDCAGGSGNGPKYVQGPVQVLGADPFDLDSDGDGVGCERD